MYNIHYISTTRTNYHHLPSSTEEHSAVPRGVKRGSRRNPATQFCAMSEITCNKRKNYIYNLLTTIYLSAGGVGPAGVSVPGILFGVVGAAGAFLEGSGA